MISLSEGFGEMHLHGPDHLEMQSRLLCGLCKANSSLCFKVEVEFGPPPHPILCWTTRFSIKLENPCIFFNELPSSCRHGTRWGQGVKT